MCTSDAETEGLEGRREETSKLAGDSGSRRSTFMVRQFIVPMIAREREEELLKVILSYCCLWEERLLSRVSTEPTSHDGERKMR